MPSGSEGKPDDLAFAHKAGAEFADLLVQQFMDEGSPFPWPRTVEEIQLFVDKVAPGAVEDIGILMAREANSPLAVRKDALYAMEQGFRSRLTELAIASL